MAHTTSFKFRAKPGERGAVINHFQVWDRERKPYVKGFLHGMLARDIDDFDAFLATVVFDTFNNYSLACRRSGRSSWAPI